MKTTRKVRELLTKHKNLVSTSMTKKTIKQSMINIHKARKQLIIEPTYKARKVLTKHKNISQFKETTNKV